MASSSLTSRPSRKAVVSPELRDVVAAGAVVLRKGKVLLVHRPRYDDWSFPKGKLDRGEHAVVAATREVREETGLTVTLGLPLLRQNYVMAAGRQRGRRKTVHYWIGRVRDDHDIDSFVPNSEVDALAWVPVTEAIERLTYEHDRVTLVEAAAVRKKTRALVVLRHAEARSRKRWHGDDRDRTLLKSGLLQAVKLAPLLAAYDCESVVSSSSARCVTTVAPYAASRGLQVQTLDALSEEGHDPATIATAMAEALAAKIGTVVCTHRPVLPTVFEALRVDVGRLDPGEMVVVHHRDDRVVATERHLVR